MTTVTTRDDWSKVANPPLMKMETEEEFFQRLNDKEAMICKWIGLPRCFGRFYGRFKW